MISYPRVAVLLAAHNDELWIEHQISSILKQERVHVDIFVSLDLSTDNTLQLLKRLGANEPQVHTLSYGQRFGGAAANFFRLLRDVDFTGYDYVALADQDDLWFANKLIHSIELLNKTPADVYSADVLAFWGDGRKKLIKKSFNIKKFDFLFESAGPGCTYVFRATSLSVFTEFLRRNFNLISEVALHDWFIYAYFRSRGFVWLIDSTPLVFYRQHGGNQFGANTGVQAYRRRMSQVRRKWYRGEVERIASILGIDKPRKLFMVKNFLELRRRTRDALLLLVFCLLGFY